MNNTKPIGVVSHQQLCIHFTNNTTHSLHFNKLEECKWKTQAIILIKRRNYISKFLLSSFQKVCAFINCIDDKSSNMSSFQLFVNLKQCVVVYSFSRHMFAHSHRHFHHYFDLCNRKFTKCDFLKKMMETIFKDLMKTQQLYCNVQMYEHPSLLDLCNKKLENQKKKKNCKLLHACELHASST